MDTHLLYAHVSSPKRHVSRSVILGAFLGTIFSWCSLTETGWAPNHYKNWHFGISFLCDLHPHNKAGFDQICEQERWPLFGLLFLPTKPLQKVDIQSFTQEPLQKKGIWGDEAPSKNSGPANTIKTVFSWDSFCHSQLVVPKAMFFGFCRSKNIIKIVFSFLYIQWNGFTVMLSWLRFSLGMF